MSGQRAQASPKSRVVILGGGYGGVYAALELQRLVARRPDIDVALISRDNFFTSTPMLPQAATSGIDTPHVVQSIRRICPRIRFLQAEIKAIDFVARTVQIEHAEGHRHTIPYDQLLIAIGGETNFFWLPGLEEHAFTIKTLGDAFALRDHALDMLEQAELEEDETLRRRLLTFVVAGAGFAGVETAAELDIFLQRAARLYKRVAPSDIRVIIVDMQTRILPELSDRLADFAASELRRRGVELRLGTRVRSADANGVEFADGTRIETMTLVWAGGVKPGPLVARTAIANERGRIPTEPTLEVKGNPGVWAVGDCAEIYPPDGGKPYPPTAQHALREGIAAGRNIYRTLIGQRPRPFAYTMIGQMAELGRHKAVAMIGGLKIRGFPAWWLWRTYYLLRMPTLERKIRVAIDWTLDLLFPRDIVKLPLPETRRPSA